MTSHIGDDFDISDVLCTICLGIVIEPVTMPCDHTICQICFHRSIEVNTLSCPLCKRRIAIWCRRNANNLVNEPLWKKIKEKFPEQVKLRLEGVELEGEDLEELFPCLPIHSHVDDGEIGAEFRKQMSEFSCQEKERKKREEEKIILRLGVDEENEKHAAGDEDDEVLDEGISQALILEQRKALQRIEQERKDEAMARALNAQLSSPTSTPVATRSSSGTKTPKSSSANKSKRKPLATTSDKKKMKQLSLQQLFKPKNN